MNALLLKLIKWGWPLPCVIYSFFPFINGLGCNFSFTHNSNTNFQHGFCKAGILNVYIKNKIDDSVILKEMRWGRDNDFVYTLMLNENKPKGSNLEEQHYLELLYSKTRLIIGIRTAYSKNNQYITYYDQPVELFYQSKIVGELGFIYSDVK